MWSTTRRPRRVMTQAARMPITATTIPVMTTVLVRVAEVASTPSIEVATTIV
jgi:hypothetical protein